MDSANICRTFFPDVLWWTKTSHACSDSKLNSKGHELWSQNLDGRKVLFCAGIQCGLSSCFLWLLGPEGQVRKDDGWKISICPISFLWFAFAVRCWTLITSVLSCIDALDTCCRKGGDVKNSNQFLYRLTKGWVWWLRSLTEHSLWA